MSAAKFAAVGGGVKNMGVGLALFAAAALVAYVAYKAKHAADKVADALKKDLNPTSDQNLINRAVHGALGSDGSWSIGTKVYDWLHPAPPDDWRRVLPKK